FLLMPMMELPREVTATKSAEELAREVNDLQEQLENANKLAHDLQEKQGEWEKKLADERQKLLQRVRILDISPTDGTLSYYDGTRVLKISTEQQAHELIESDRRSQGASGQQVVYIFRYPREPGNPFPKSPQRKDYERWFKDVQTSWDYL